MLESFFITSKNLYSLKKALSLKCIVSDSVWYAVCDAVSSSIYSSVESTLMIAVDVTVEEFFKK